MNAIRKERWLWTLVPREYCGEVGGELRHADEMGFEQVEREREDGEKLGKTQNLFTSSLLTLLFNYIL